MPGYTYVPPAEAPPKGQWKSYYGGFERTPFARYACGATVTEFTRDISPDARRARIRERKRARIDEDAFVALCNAMLDEQETDATKEFYNGG